MPTSLNYPGVYLEELPSGVHTITGVATSIAAFIGWAPQGPTGQAILVDSWSDFHTQFGGLHSKSYLGYAVNQFFANGGQQAYIVRLVSTDASASSNAADTSTNSVMLLYANNPGVWGNALSVVVTPPVTDLTGAIRFGIQVQMNGTLVENFVNLSALPTDAQYVVNVIETESQHITFTDPLGKAEPLAKAPTTALKATLSAGSDGAVLMPGDGAFETALTAVTTAGESPLDRVDGFNLLCVPGETDVTAIGALQKYCASKRAFYIVDSPPNTTVAGFTITANNTSTTGPIGTSIASTGARGPAALRASAYSSYSAYYFPWLLAADPLGGFRPRPMPPSGFVAGIYAATDASRGVWKSPAGIDTALTGVLGLQAVLTDLENGTLNVLGINCIRQFKVYGDVVWGARTLEGADLAGSQWKYVSVRRLALYIESSLFDGTQWVVFEPNDEPLWSQIRLNVGAFMQALFMQGAFQGSTPQQAYFVKCDSENNPQASIDLGVVNILVGFAPLYPAEFVVIEIQQIAGQIQ